MKSCTVCKIAKELHEFDKIRNSKGEQAPTGRCKECRRSYIRAYKRRKSHATGLNREDYLKSAGKPKVSTKERYKAGKDKWDAWYAEYKESGIVERMQEEWRKKAEQERVAALETGVRVCGTCKEEKPLSQYHMRNRKRKDGSVYAVPYSTCKTCRRNNNRYYNKTPTGKEVKKRNRVMRDRRSKKATPKWLTPEQRKQIVDIYEHMRDCRVVTGEDYHVDHIVPLRGENVCGLHVPWNLQVLPASVNMAKSNQIEVPPLRTTLQGTLSSNPVLQ